MSAGWYSRWTAISRASGFRGVRDADEGGALTRLGFPFLTLNVIAALVVRVPRWRWFSRGARGQATPVDPLEHRSNRS
jgi:hypothetical protein